MFKRTLCLLLALVSVIGLLPMTALAAEKDLPELFGSLDNSLNSKARASTGNSYVDEYGWWYYSMPESEKTVDGKTVSGNNNSFSRADTIPVSSKQHILIDGHIRSTDDSKDYYKFSVTEWTYLVVLVDDGLYFKNSQYTLYDSDGDKVKTIPYKNKWGSGTSADTIYLLEYIIKPGTYYIRAYEPGKSGYSSIGSQYSIIVHQFPALKTPSVTASNDKDSGKPVLKWSAIPDADYYRVYRSTSKNGTYSKLKDVTDTTFTDTSAKAGKAYYYKVKAFTYDPYYSESGLKGNASSADKKTCKCARPDVDISLKSGKPRLNWDDISGAKNYVVYRATSKSGEYKKIATVSNSVHTDKTAKKGKTYYYKVKAVSSVTSAANSVFGYVDSIKATK